MANRDFKKHNSKLRLREGVEKVFQDPGSFERLDLKQQILSILSKEAKRRNMSKNYWEVSRTLIAALLIARMLKVVF